MGKLDADWLSVEFASAEAEFAGWGEGLRASLIERDTSEPEQDVDSSLLQPENQDDFVLCQ